MKKILIYFNRTESVDRRVIEPTNYKSLWSEDGHFMINSGNKLWLQAVIQYLTKPNIEYNYLDAHPTYDEINSEYNMVVVPRANMFGIYNIETIQKLTNEFKNIRIPIYVIGVGAQAQDYDDINRLYFALKGYAKDFIRTVYNTGGDFALRGYFTKELFDKFGFKNAVVTGCPSFYQMGRNLTIRDNKVNKEEFKPLINGNINYITHKHIHDVFREYKDSVFMDQSEFIEILYSRSFKKENDLEKKHIRKLIKKYTIEGINLLCENRIKLYYDIPTWFDYIRGYNFSLGKRIHGNIAAMLNGIPAVVHYHDSRTRELAEFFDIPSISKITKSVYGIYLEADYTKFNKTFKTKFDNFERFLANHNITENIDNSEEFNILQSKIKYLEPEIINKSFIDRLGKLPGCQASKRMIFYSKLNEAARYINFTLPQFLRHPMKELLAALRTKQSQKFLILAILPNFVINFIFNIQSIRGGYLYYWNDSNSGNNVNSTLFKKYFICRLALAHSWYGMEYQV